MLGALIGPEIQELVRSRDFVALRTLLAPWSAPDLAELLSEIDAEDQAVVFRILPRESASQAFAYLPLVSQESLLKALGQDQVAAILNDMSADDRTALLEELPGEVTKKLLELLTPQERTIAQRLLGYAEGSVGRLMTPDYLAVREEWTVSDVLRHVRSHGRDSETLNVLCVVDDRGALLDDVRLRDVLLSPEDRRLSDLMDRKFIALQATEPQENAVKMFADYDRTAIPVTDTHGLLVGIVTIDDVLDVAQAAATEDFQKAGGMEALDEPYLSITIPRMIRKRGGWLVLLFLSEMLTATALGFFEGQIAKAVVLALFLPLIISSGGNSGSQASTLVIRALAVGEVRLRDWARIMRRELICGVALGVILGTVGFLRIAVWSTFSDIYGPHWDNVALTIFLSLIGVVLWGTLIGSMLPLLIKRLGGDPAVSSTPFVATLVDVTGIIIYFSVAMLTLTGHML